MKAIFFVIGIMLFGKTAIGQIYGVNFRLAKPFYECIPEEIANADGLFLKFKKEEYSFLYQTTPVGVKHSVEKLYYILENNKNVSQILENDSSIRLPDLDESLYAPYVTHEFEDYHNISLSCRVGDSEVKKLWNLDNGWSVRWIVDEESSEVSMKKE